MTRDDFKVGQTVYLKTISHVFDCWKNERLIEAVVTKIGRKYIHVSDVPHREYRFDINNNFREVTAYTPSYGLYLSKQDIFDYWNRWYLILNIKNVVSNTVTKLEIEKLMEIATILRIPPFNKHEDADGKRTLEYEVNDGNAV